MTAAAESRDEELGAGRVGTSQARGVRCGWFD